MSDANGPGCIFCQIVADRSPAARVAEDEHTLAFLDIFPATPGHTLVVPKTHARDLLDVSSDDLAACTAMAQRVARRLVSELGADGVNLINACGAAAWQTVFHVHLHVVPRYSGRDQLVQPWTPAPGDPAEMTALAERLRA
ncbi:HIT family protein [Nocardioides sp.]|uniref:HIT family protein n=1 Tax=Nocardioides sp. TaxID=35761 RepID=UPI002B270E64|nr:HIT family protein [Nocardioides sp.]